MRMRFLMTAFVIVCCAQPGQASTLSGKVTDSSGAPAPGVKVYAISSGAAADPCEPRTDGSSTTSDGGSYSISDLPELGENQARYVVAVSRAGTIGWRLAEVGNKQFAAYLKPSPDIELLTMQGTTTGRVVDAKGKPIPGVSVEPGVFVADQMNSIPAPLLKLVTKIPSAVTGSDGKYALAKLPGAADPCLSFKKGNLVSRNASYTAQDTATVMVPAGSIVGTVLAPDGKPVPRAKIRAVSREHAYYTAEAGTDGKYELELLLPGEYTVTASAPAAGVIGTLDGVRVGSNKQTAAPALKCTRTALLEGRVIYADSGKPAGGVSVMGSGMSTLSSNDEAVTDESTGDFKLALPPGKVSIYCFQTPPGYLANDRPEVTLPPAGLKGVEIRLEKAAVGKGRVVDAIGTPVSGIGVYDHNAGGYAVTGTDGRFTLTLPEEGRDLPGFAIPGKIILRLSSMGDSPGRGQEVAVDRSALVQGTAVVTSSKPSTLDVYVTLPNGKPAAGAEIGLRAIPAYASKGNYTISTKEGRTDARGHLRVGSIYPGGEYDVSAVLPGYYDPGKRPATAFSSKPQTVRIRLSAATRVQTGKVLDEAGNPVSGAHVDADMEATGSTLASTRTDVEGRFTLTGLPDGRVNITASKGNMYAGTTVNKATGPVVIQLFPAPGASE